MELKNKTVALLPENEMSAAFHYKDLIFCIYNVCGGYMDD